MNKRLIIITAIILVVGFLVVLYFLFRSTDNDHNQQGVYPEIIQQVIDNPVEKISDDFNNIIKNDKFLISYGGDQNQGTFFITVNAEPVVEVSKQAEQEFLNRLQIDQAYACSLTVILNVPYAVDSNLSGYDFGMSFCSDRIHIEDVPRQPTENTRYYDSADESQSSQTNLIR